MLTKLAFTKLGHPFQPFIFGQRSVGPKMALQHNVRLVFYGENVAEYGNPLEENYNPQMDVSIYYLQHWDRKTAHSRSYDR